jgi:glutamate dehydrogenase (NAD(P)+)
MMDTYQMIYGGEDINSEACVTGKHFSRGGIKGSIEAKGLGAYYGIRNMLDNDEFCKKAKLSKGIAGKTFTIQGFARLGKWASHYISKDGGIITTIITDDVAIHDSKGINIEKATQWYRANNGLANYPDFEKKGK